MFGDKKEAVQTVTPAVLREANVRHRKDRIGVYLKHHMNKFTFSEFSESYMQRGQLADIMRGVPIPLREEDRAAFAGGEGIKAHVLINNMVMIMGIDPHFKHVERYLAFFEKLFNKKICGGILKKGRNLAEKKEYELACIYFRATLCIDPTYLHGMYSYARVCRAMYMESSDEEYVGRFKAEAMDYFELLTEIHPRFAQAYYYLGYAYLNMGLYVKAQLAWQGFIKRSQHPKDRREIKERIRQIQEPVEIEAGYNAVLTGRYEEGLTRLEPYMNSRFIDWWPLSYYLGVCYARLGRKQDAMASFKKTLSLNGSHLETMKELVVLYEAAGDAENQKKYRDKIQLIQADLDEEEQIRKKKLMSVKGKTNPAKGRK